MNERGNLQPVRTREPSEGERIRDHLLPKKAAVLDKLAELAAAGDPRSIQLYLQYVSPPARPDAERVSIEGLASAATLQGKADCIIAAVSTGQISVEAGEKALALLEKYVRTVVADDHERRLQAIEQGGRSANVIDVAPNDPSPEDLA